ncbi:MAG: type II toxin-antitoxin system RelE/ParE family toxin [Verrucomicrobiae bacterium]|nr:type II toxin-antitoxin system RelE/ParE family toxin [Verrucomicrobiae bacterium]
MQIELKPKAEKDLKLLSSVYRSQVIEKLRWLEDHLRGDVKKLTNFTPEYRMRSGDYRVLFEVAKDTIVVYRILHRREVYR